MELAAAPTAASVSATACPFFQYLATLLPNVLTSVPATYTLPPATAIELATARWLPSVSVVTCPFFQYLATSIDPLKSQPVTYISLPTTDMEDVSVFFVP